MITSRSADDQDDGGSRFPVAPGLVVLGLGLLLICAIIAAVVVSNRPEGNDTRAVTIAELRADPDGWDNRAVELRGSAEGIRELPYLSQYALYTFRDDTGTIWVLTQKGAPPSDPPGAPIVLRGVYHSKVTLDDELKRIIEEQLGSLAGSIIGMLVPGVPLNVVFLEHQSYEAQ